MKNSTIEMIFLVLGLIFVIPLPTYGQLNSDIFLVRKEANRNRVYAVHGVPLMHGPNVGCDSIDLKGRVLYDHCGRLFSVSRDKDFVYYLDSVNFLHPNDCSDSNPSSFAFSNLLKYQSRNSDRSIIAGLERGESELKCSEKFCIVYYEGLRIIHGLESVGEVILPREAVFGGTWSFDFFRNRYLVIVARWYNSNPILESHAYVIDLETRKLLWRSKVDDDILLMDVKVVRNDVYIIYRQSTSELFSIPPTPSRCIIINFGSFWSSPRMNFVREFDGSVIEIL